MKIELPERFRELQLTIDREEDIRDRANALIRVKGVRYVTNACRQILAGRVEKAEAKGRKGRNHQKYLALIAEIDASKERANTMVLHPSVKRRFYNSDVQRPVGMVVHEVGKDLVEHVVRCIRKGAAK